LICARNHTSVDLLLLCPFLPSIPPSAPCRLAGAPYNPLFPHMAGENE